MQKFVRSGETFFRSGGFFFIVALISMAAGTLAERGAVFISLGLFWLIVGLAVRSKNAAKSGSDAPNEQRKPPLR